MSKTTRYLLVSLPTSISPSRDHDEAFTALRSAVSTDHGTVYPFAVPEFKIGTLDALVQQADELSRLEGVCEGVVGKVGDSLRTILEGDEDKIIQQKTVTDSQSNPGVQLLCMLIYRLQSLSINIYKGFHGTGSSTAPTSLSGTSWTLCKRSRCQCEVREGRRIG